MKQLGKLASVALCVAAALAPVQAAELTGHQFDGNQLVLTTDEGRVVLAGYGEGTIAVHYQNPGIKQLPSFAIDETAPVVKGELVKDEGKLHYRFEDIEAVITPNPFQLSFYRDGELLVAEEQGLVLNDEQRGFRFSLAEGEKLLGGGQRVLGMDRRGHRLPLYNKASYGYTTHAEQMYFGLSAVMSDKHYALVFDNSANGWMDLGKTDKDVLAFEAMGGRTAYLVSAGDDQPDLIENFTAAVGRQPLPPRWALGNYASRFGYRTEAEVRATVDKFIEQDFPLDALVLDLYWFGKDIQGHMGKLDWDREAFPNPEGMIADLKEKGVNTILISEPFILTTSDRWDEAVDAGALAMGPDGKPTTFDFYFGNTGLVDVFDADAQDWFWGIYDNLQKQGVAGWWGDLGEPEVHPADSQHAIGSGDEVHNAYGHEWAKLVYQGLREAQPDQRPMIMMRSGFVGSQRYGMVPWTGDVSRSWGGLKPQVELALQMGVMGLGYIHSDLGGFAGGDAFDSELYIRWLQYGVFQPVYRPHAQEHIPSEPVFHDKHTQDIVREYVKLRYALLPYLYTLSYENSTTGMPLMRPLSFEDPALFDNKDAYLWGDAFLVSPVVDPGVTEQTVALPKGSWFDYFRGTRYEGGQDVSLPVSLETLPVLVRAGSFVPMVKPVQSTKDYNTQALTLHYYADASISEARGQMYEDDGRSAGSLTQGQFELLGFNAKHKGDALTISLERDGKGYDGMPGQRAMELVIHNWNKAPGKVTLNGKTLDFNHSDDTLTVAFDWNHGDAELVIR